MISKQQKGVSPVIGVILMVAITVIIAAVVANFVLNLGSNLEQDADATVTFDQEIDNFGMEEYVVTVTVSRMDNADYLVVTTQGTAGDDPTATHSGPGPGDVDSAPDNAGDSQSITDGNNDDGVILVSSGDVGEIGGLLDGEVVQIFGGLDGKENLINSYETEGTLG